MILRISSWNTYSILDVNLTFTTHGTRTFVSFSTSWLWVDFRLDFSYLSSFDKSSRVVLDILTSHSLRNPMDWNSLIILWYIIYRLTSSSHWGSLTLRRGQHHLKTDVTWRRTSSDDERLVVTKITFSHWMLQFFSTRQTLVIDDVFMAFWN